MYDWFIFRPAPINYFTQHSLYNMKEEINFVSGFEVYTPMHYAGIRGGSVGKCENL